MKLIVGLGNPTEEYKNTRHNIGFMFLDYLLGDKFVLNKKFNSYEYIDNIGTEKIIYIKPLSYMNLSGNVVRKYMDYYKIDLDSLFVIQDDLDMNIGNYKFLFNRGDGGHNGIKDIINKVSDKNFLRLKIGISKVDNILIRDYVLGKFTNKDLLCLNKTFDILRNVIDDYVLLSRDKLIQKYNTRLEE